jgi:hypothetical protein
MMTAMGSKHAVIVMALAACGPADPDAPSTDGAGAGESFEAAPYDVERVRLEQTENSDIAPTLSLACSNANGTNENSWYRIFYLPDFGVDKAFTVNRVNFGVQTAIGDNRVKVSVGTYAGPAGALELDLTKFDVLAMNTVGVSEGKAFMAQAMFPAVEVPRGSNLVVEVKTEGPGDGSYFYLGATTATEMVPGYLRAPACDTPNPRMTSALGSVQTHLVIAVSGTY